MIVITSPLMQDKVKKILENVEKYNLTYLKTEGINIFYETTDDEDEVLSEVKYIIKNNPISSSLIIKARKE